MDCWSCQYCPPAMKSLIRLLNIEQQNKINIGGECKSEFGLLIKAAKPLSITFKVQSRYESMYIQTVSTTCLEQTKQMNLRWREREKRCLTHYNWSLHQPSCISSFVMFLLTTCFVTCFTTVFFSEYFTHNN